MTITIYCPDVADAAVISSVVFPIALNFPLELSNETFSYHKNKVWIY